MRIFLVSCEVNHFRHFLSSGWKSFFYFFVHFVATQGQRLPEVSLGSYPRRDSNPDPWICSQKPWPLGHWVNVIVRRGFCIYQQKMHIYLIFMLNTEKNDFYAMPYRTLCNPNDSVTQPLGKISKIPFVPFVAFRLVMGPGLKFLTWVGSAIYGLGLNLENFP